MAPPNWPQFKAKRRLGNPGRFTTIIVPARSSEKEGICRAPQKAKLLSNTRLNLRLVCNADVVGDGGALGESIPDPQRPEGTQAVQCSDIKAFAQLRLTPRTTGHPAMPTYVHLRTLSLGIPVRPATHNPLVVGSSPTGPTILKAARCAAFVFLHEPWR